MSNPPANLSGMRSRHCWTITSAVYSSVKVRGWILSGWQPDDLAYMHAETQAALLAWLWSLPCPVVNRYSPAIWYSPKVSLLCWQYLLRRCGFPTLETLVTNEEEEARAFGQRLAQEGVAGAVYGPLTSEARYLIIDDKDWNGLAAMQRCAPVCLTYPHGAAQFVCLAGEHVVWEGEPPPEAALLEPAIRRFALETGLAFVAFAFAQTAQGFCVIAVESHPYFEHFGDAARQQIVEGIGCISSRRMWITGPMALRNPYKGASYDSCVWRTCR